jgi:low temperature requirement protein LtrA
VLTACCRCCVGITPNAAFQRPTSHKEQIANFADELTENPSGIRLVIFILVFTPAWHAWADAKENANNYYNDDLLQRIAILWIMALLILYGNNANFVGEDLWAQRITVAAYQCIRFTQIAFFFMYSLASHHHRIQNRIYAGMTFIGLLIWIPIYFEEVSDKAKIAVAAVAILWEEFSYVIGFTPLIPKKFGLEYTTAVDIGHENDRYTAFTIIVLGEFTYVVVVG